MQRLPQRTVAYLIAAAGIIGIMAVFFLAIEPQRQKIIDVSKQVTLADVELELAEQSADKVSQFQQEYQNILNTDVEINKHLFAVGDELNFFKLIEGLAKDSGVEISITFTPKSHTTSLEMLPLELSASGNSGSVIAFLDKLERTTQYIILKSITLQGGESVSATLKFDTYWYDPNE